MIPELKLRAPAKRTKGEPEGGGAGRPLLAAKAEGEISEEMPPPMARRAMKEERVVRVGWREGEGRDIFSVVVVVGELGVFGVDGSVFDSTSTVRSQALYRILEIVTSISHDISCHAPNTVKSRALLFHLRCLVIYM